MVLKVEYFYYLEENHKNQKKCNNQINHFYQNGLEKH